MNGTTSLLLASGASSVSEFSGSANILAELSPAAQNAFNLLRASTSGSVSAEKATITQPAFLQEIDKSREEMNQKIVLDKNVIASSVAASAGVSLGYVIWLLRGGVLLSSLVAAMPAWRSIDPFPVLANLNNTDDQDDETLQSMLERAKKKLVKPQPLETSESLSQT
jgi:hypothetical protein